MGTPGRTWTQSPVTKRKQIEMIKAMEFGYKPWRICQDYGVSQEMLAAVLVEQGKCTTMQSARARVHAGMRPETSGGIRAGAIPGGH